jgi:hypothetical protein
MAEPARGRAAGQGRARTLTPSRTLRQFARTMTREKMNRVSLGLLALGLGSALVIFLVTAPEVVDPLLGDPYSNKKYLREMRMLGGQGNVLAAEFQDWFAGLWHGRALAGTVAVLTVVTVLVFRFIASHPPLPKVERTEDRTPPAA